MADGQNDDRTPDTADEKPAGKAPRFDGEFDPERAARLIENLRSDLDKIKAERDELRTAHQEREDAEKTELEKLRERAERAEAGLKDAQLSSLRSTVARKHQLPDELLDYLNGDDEESLNAKAETLAKYARRPADDLPGRPKPDLVPGEGDDSDDAPFDPAAIAKQARNRF